MSEKIIVYGTPTCPMVPPVRNLLKRASAEYTYIDISRDTEAMAIVKGINNGNASVPTLVFSDGKTLTEPSNAQLHGELAARGYQIEQQTIGGRIALLLQSPALAIAGTALLIVYLLDRSDTFMLALGLTLLAAFFITRTLAK